MPIFSLLHFSYKSGQEYICRLSSPQWDTNLPKVLNPSTCQAVPVVSGLRVGFDANVTTGVFRWSQMNDITRTDNNVMKMTSPCACWDVKVFEVIIFLLVFRLINRYRFLSIELVG